MKLFAYPSECSWQLLINAGLLFSGGREEGRSSAIKFDHKDVIKGRI